MARPRSAHAHGQVLDAALALFAERGIDATSMDAIAEASGVSKATIYNHWPDKDALCLEAMAHLLGPEQLRPACDTGDVRADMIALLSYEPPHRRHDLRMRLMPHLWAYAARNPSFGKAWRQRVFEPPRAQLTQLLERAIAQGQLPRSLDRALALALLLGPLMYCRIWERMQGEVPANLAEQVVAAFWTAHAIAPPLGKRRMARGKSRNRSQ
ncbi:MAG TPA: TetR/AcrR family transcriptional regulator [Gemmataceae bacterium]|jgi:AcrR family transcriptional regulator|nr:TetR/AcrR family transcriptional regulator [Gemmataceae bacterium]